MMNYAEKTARSVQSENSAKGGQVPDRLKPRLAQAKARELEMKLAKSQAKSQAQGLAK